MPKWYRLNQNGNWTPLKTIYRLNQAGKWIPLKTIYRLNQAGKWIPVFSSQPVPLATTNPVLKNQLQSRDNFYGGDVLTLTRGVYTNTTSADGVDPANVQYRMRIYKTSTTGSSSPPTTSLSTWTMVAERIETGTSSTGSTQLTYTITNNDAKNISWFAAEVRVDNDISNVNSDKFDFETVLEGGANQRVLSRIFFETSSFTVNDKSTSATFAWNVTGIPDTTYLYQDASNSASIVRITRSENQAFVYDAPASISSLSGTATVPVGTLTAETGYRADLIIRGNDGWKTDNNFTKNNKGAEIDGSTFVTFFTPNIEPVNTVSPIVSPLNNRGRWPINTATNTTLSITNGTWNNLSTPTYSYKWEYLDTTWVTASTTSTVNFSNALSGFNARCTVRATNSDGGFGEVVVTGILDAGPTVSTITPINVETNSNTEFSYTITGYPTSYSINWGDSTSSYLSGTISANSTSTITAASTLTSPNRIVYTCSSNHNFLQGMKISITGVNPTGYNISNATILSTTSNTFTILGTPGAAYISGGSATSDSSIIYGKVLKTYTAAATRTATVTAEPGAKASTTNIVIQDPVPGPLVNFTRQLASLANVARDKRFTWTAPTTGGSITKYQFRINNGTWSDVPGGNTATQLDLYNFLIQSTSSTGTIGTVSGSFTATITGMSSTTEFFVGQNITSTPGTGSFGSGTMTVTSIVSSTSITVSSSATFTAGTVTNIIGAISHTVEVRAVGPGGNGTASSSGPFNLPAILTGPAVTSIQDTTASTSWTRSNNVTSGTLTLSPTITGSPFSVGTNTSQSLTTLVANTLYTATLVLGSSTSDTHQQTASFTTLQPRLNPTFSAITKTSSGYTGSVNNYNSSFTYNTPSTINGDLSAGTWTWGSASGSNYPFTVSGLTPGQSAGAVVRTTRSGYANGSGNISGTALFAALNPAFGTLTQGNQRIDSSVTNYDANWTWSFSVSAGTFTWGTASGSTRPFSVTGLSNGQSTTVTITTTRTDYVQGSNSQSGSALATGLTPSFGTNTSGTNSFAGSVTNYNDSYNWFNSVSVGTFTWGTVPSGGIGTRTFSVTGLSAGQSSTVTITTTRTGFLNGSNSTTGSASLATGLTPTFGTLTSGDGRIDSSVTNYDANYSWSLTASVGTVSPTTFTGTGTTKTFSVTGLSDGQSTTVTVTTTRTGYNNGSNSQSGSALSAGLTPSFGANTSGVGLFAGSVTNYNTDYGWSASPSVGTFTWGSLPATNPGTRTFTVSALSPGQSSTLTVTTSRSGFKNGSASTTGSAQAGLTVPGIPQMTYDSNNSTATNWAYDIRFTPSSGSGTIQYQLECRGPSPTPTTTVTRPSTAGTYYATNIVSSLQEIQNVLLARTILTWQSRARATNDNGSTFTGWSDWGNFA